MPIRRSSRARSSTCWPRSCGCGAQVAAVTEAAMAGEIDFEEALRQRVGLLAGLDQSALDRSVHRCSCHPGARTLVRTLKRLGYETAMVRGGFTQVIGRLAAELGIDHLAANELEIEDGVLTGGLVGPIVDRVGKAEALVRFAAAAGVPRSRTIAVGDGANDLDMLAVAGLGIAFKPNLWSARLPIPRSSVPYLDAILFLLGIGRDEVETADQLEQAGGDDAAGSGERRGLRRRRAGGSAPPDIWGRRPLLRGWLHVAALVAWLVGGPFLIAAGPDAGSKAALTVYVLAMLAMFGVSAAVPSRPLERSGLAPHAAGGSQRHLHRHRRDVDGGGRPRPDGLVPGSHAQPGVDGCGRRHCAAPGLARCAAVGRRRPLRRGGMVLPDCGPTAVPRLGGVGFALMLLAGFFYTAGALIYARKRPDPWPNVFGFHEVFHACTVIGAGMFAYLIAFIALPRYWSRGGGPDPDPGSAWCKSSIRRARFTA